MQAKLLTRRTTGQALKKKNTIAHQSAPTLQEILHSDGAPPLSEMVDWEKYGPIVTDLAAKQGKKFDKLSDTEQDEIIQEAVLPELSGRYQRILALFKRSGLLTIYRAIDTPAGISGVSSSHNGGLTTDGFGVYWSWSETGAQPYCSEYPDSKTLVFKGAVPHESVDWLQTFYLNVVDDEENEVRLKAKARIRVDAWRESCDGVWQNPPQRLRVVTAAKTAKEQELESDNAAYDEDGYWAGEGNAASGILAVAKDTRRVCLAWRSSEVHTGDCWGLIGGAVQEGKEPGASAAAEMKEEVGYAGSVNIHAGYVFKDGKFSYHNFVGEVDREFGFNPAPKHAWETDFIEWKTLDEWKEEMKDNPGDFHPGVITFFEHSADLIESVVNGKTKKKPEVVTAGVKKAQVIGPVYHGTTYVFDEFKRNKGLRSGFLGSTIETGVFAYFFSKNKSQAIAYAKNRQLHTKEPARLITANLTINHMLDLTNPEWVNQPIVAPPLPLHKAEPGADPEDVYEDHADELGSAHGLLDYMVNYLLVDEMSEEEWVDLGIDPGRWNGSVTGKPSLDGENFRAWELFDNKKVSDALRYLGFDGAKVPEGDDAELGGESYCVFSSDQVKILSNVDLSTKLRAAKLLGRFLTVDELRAIGRAAIAKRESETCECGHDGGDHDLFNEEACKYSGCGCVRFKSKNVSKKSLTAAKKCTCGHTWDEHVHMADFGCKHEKEGCGCLGWDDGNGIDSKTGSAIPHSLKGLAAEARKCATFPEFKNDFLNEIKHGRYWHLTDNPDFTIEASKGPRDMSSMSDGKIDAGKLMITSDLRHWESYYNYDRDEKRKVTRPYAALIDMSAVPRNAYHLVSRGFGNEFWVDDPSQARVTRVMPIKVALANDRAYAQTLAQQFNSDADLLNFWEQATGNTAARKEKTTPITAFSDEPGPRATEPLTSKPKVASPDDLQHLKHYLTLSPREMGEELARYAPHQFQEYVEEYAPEALDQFGEDEYIDDYSGFEDSVLTGFLNSFEMSQDVVSDPYAPTFLSVQYDGDVRDQWLVHFTNHAAEIAKEGFKYGVADVDRLAITTNFRDEDKQTGGYNFAFPADDLHQQETGMYGKDCVVFKASGIKTTHVIDNFTQVIFWGADAHSIVPIFHQDKWMVPSRDGKKPLFSGDLDDAVSWVEKNAAKYLGGSNRQAKLLTRKAMPDFGYSQYNEDKQKALKTLSLESVDLGIGLLEVSAYRRGHRASEEPEGYVCAERLYDKQGNYLPSYAVNRSNIKDEWRGTGLGQMLYDRIISQARQKGAEFFYSDVDRSPDAERAWDRLAKRYHVDFDHEMQRYRIDLRSASSAEPKAAAKRTPTPTKIKDFSILKFRTDTNADWEGGDGFTIYADEPNPYSQRGLSQVGHITIETPESAFIPDAENLHKVYVHDVNVEEEWRGTGLGQKLYDMGFAEAKKRGAEFIYQSLDQTPEARAAWRRLAQRYPVKRDRTLGLKYIDLRSSASIDAVAEPKAAAKKKQDITETPAFKAWFGNSKVVDSEGKPMVVHHGTDAEFDAFDRDKTKSGPSKFGFWFAQDKDFAELFGSKQMATYLKIERPYKITSGRWNAIRDAHAKDTSWFERWRDKIIKEGYDGLIVEGEKFTSSKGIQLDDPSVFAVFEPTQIKSVQNNGAFDPKNPVITAAATEGLPEDLHQILVRLPNESQKQMFNIVKYEDGDNFGKIREIIEHTGVSKDDSASIAKYFVARYTPSREEKKELARIKSYPPTVFDPVTGVGPVYHGSPYRFKTFSPRTIGKASGNRGYLGAGFYFSANYETARAYGDVTVYHLDVHKPLVINEPLSREAADFLNHVTESPDFFVAGQTRCSTIHTALSDAISNEPEFADEFTKTLKKAGYDCLFYNNMDEIVVYSNQVIHRFDGRKTSASAAPTQDQNIDHSKQTESPAFKAWFGKSKVVDDHGRPLVVYHGTDASFEAFDPDRVGSSSTKQMDNIQGVLWFAQSPEGGSYFSGGNGHPGANVIPVFLSLQNPRVVDVAKDERARDQYFKLKGKTVYDIRYIKGYEIVEAQQAGNDGVIFENGYDGTPGSGTVYAVFNPSAVKSAIGNNGEFSPTNHSITASAGAGCDWLHPRKMSLTLNSLETEFDDFNVLIMQFVEDGTPRYTGIAGTPKVDWEKPIQVNLMSTEEAFSHITGPGWELDPDDRGEPHIEALMDAMREGFNLPPAIVDHSGRVIDGRHRIHAASRLGVNQIPYINIVDCVASKSRKNASEKDALIDWCNPVDGLTITLKSMADGDPRSAAKLKELIAAYSPSYDFSVQEDKPVKVWWFSPNRFDYERGGHNVAQVDQVAEEMQNGKLFAPPSSTVESGFDGNHRVKAASKLGLKPCPSCRPSRLHAQWRGKFY